MWAVPGVWTIQIPTKGTTGGILSRVGHYALGLWLLLCLLGGPVARWGEPPSWRCWWMCVCVCCVGPVAFSIGDSVPRATASSRSQRCGHWWGVCSDGAALQTQPILEDWEVVRSATIPWALLLYEVIPAVLNTFWWNFCPVGWPFRVFPFFWARPLLPSPPFWGSLRLVPLWLRWGPVAGPVGLLAFCLSMQPTLGNLAQLSPYSLFVWLPTRRPPVSRRGCPAWSGSWLPWGPYRHRPDCGFPAMHSVRHKARLVQRV